MEAGHDNQPTPPDTKSVKKDIDRRVDRTLANPFLLPEDRIEIDQLANLARFAIETKNPIISLIYDSFRKLTDPLMAPEEAEEVKK